MKSIKFDLSCFKAEFQEFIFKKLNCNDYFEFINSYNNDFILNIDNCEQDVKVPILEEDIQSCTYKNISKECIEESSSIVQSELNNENIIDSSVDSNVEKIFSQIDSECSEDEEEKIDIQFSHYIENNQIYVTPNKKFISKRLGKNIKKNGGYWVKAKNLWIFPISSKSYIENTLNSKNNSSLIKNINQEKDKVVITPKLDHPKYASPTIYDKSGNLGVWDNLLKSWIFQKKN